jgi:hypothetical protein
MTTEEAASDAEHPEEEAPETEVDRLMSISRKLTAWNNLQPTPKQEEK